VAESGEGPAGPTPPDGGNEESSAHGERALPAEAVDAWRTWLLTGKPGVVTDRRRVRGSHRGLKQMLVDGTGHDKPESWKHFSGAMVRLAISDALNALPKEQTHAVWLAYFGGMSNSEIAKRLGISAGAVEGRLKHAFELVSDYVEHGRTAGRRAIFGILGWFSLRKLTDWLRQGQHAGTHPALTNAFVAAGATVAVVVGAASTGQVASPPIAPVTVTRVAAPPSLVGSAKTTDLQAATQPVSGALKAAVGGVTKKVVRGAVTVPPAPSVPPVPSPPPLPSPIPIPFVP